MDKGREADISKLSSDLKTAKNPLQISRIHRAGKKIAEEQKDRYKRDAREALLRAARNGRPEEEKDIADQIIEHNEREKVNVVRTTIRYAPGQYRRLFGHD